MSKSPLSSSGFEALKFRQQRFTLSHSIERHFGKHFGLKHIISDVSVSRIHNSVCEGKTHFPIRPKRPLLDSADIIHIAHAKLTTEWLWKHIRIQHMQCVRGGLKGFEKIVFK